MNSNLRHYLMTIPERRVFDKIKNNLSDKYTVFPQICLRSILSDDFQENINAKWFIVDYLVCKMPYYEPFAIIELDDFTHGKEERIKRDLELDELLDRLNIPIWHLMGVSSKVLDDNLNFQLDMILEGFNSP